MPTFISLPTPSLGGVLVVVEHIDLVRTLPDGDAIVELMGGTCIATTLKPAEILDLIEAAMHPTTETETR